jgi:hypothetical protein
VIESESGPAGDRGDPPVEVSERASERESEMQGACPGDGVRAGDHLCFSWRVWVRACPESGSVHPSPLCGVGG